MHRKPPLANSTDSSDPGEPFDLSQFVNARSSSFAAVMSKIPGSIPIDQASSVFDALSDNLCDRKIDTSAKKRILSAIRSMINSQDIREFFTEKHLLDLPYDDDECADEICDIVFDVLNFNPDLFTKHFTDKKHFLQVARIRPQKTLALISRAAKNFLNRKNDFELPMPLIELLIDNHKEFLKPELFESYTSFVIFLAQEVSLFRKKCLRKIWDIYCALLDGSVESRRIYCILCYLRDEFKHTDIVPELPIVRIINDIQIHELQSPILALLVDRAATDSESIRDAELTQKLLNIAEKDASLKATVVLMKLSDNLKIAKDIISDGYWFTRKLPEPVDTLRLFLAVFRHHELRAEIAQLENFIPFLRFVIEEIGTPGVITILCTIMRRIPLSKEFIDKLNQEGFVHEFVEKTLETDDESKVSIHSLLLFINTLSEYTFLPEYLSVTPIVVQYVKKESNLQEIASYVALSLARYPQCLKKMVELELPEFFEQHRKDKQRPRLAKNAPKFLAKVH